MVPHFNTPSSNKQRPMQENQCLLTGKSGNRAAVRLSQAQLEFRSSWKLTLLQSPLMTVALCQASEEFVASVPSTVYHKTQ